jgi:hypothetical protein
MATIRERLVYAIDVVADQATRGINGFKSSVASAEGAVGKFKAGASSAFASIQQNAGLLAVGAGTALVGVGVKAVASFENLAIAAGKFSDATGLAVEDASRLIEVSGDVGISTETIQGAIVKLNKAAGSGDLAKLGIELKTTADGATDVNATFLETIRVIQQIKDPTERALAAQKAFGRGYAEIAELIGTNATELKQRLDDVSGAKVITKGELDRAREFRKDLDDLKDSAEDLGLTIGGVVVPAVTNALDAFKGWFSGISDSGAALGDFLRNGNLDQTHFVEQFKEGRQAAEEFDRTLLDGLTTFEQVRQKVLDVTGSLDAANVVALQWADTNKKGADAAGEAADAVADLGDKANNAGPKIGDMAGALDDAQQKLADLNEEARNNALDALAAAAQAVGDAVESAFDKVRDNLDLQDLVDNITDDFGKVAEAQKDATDPEGLRKYNREVRNLQRDLLNLLDSIKGIPPDKRIQIAAQIQSGDLDQLYRILGDLTKGVTVPVSFAVAKTDAFSSLNGVFTPGAAPSAPTFNNLTSAPKTSGYIDNSTTIINNPIGSTPTTQYIDGQTDFRRNGLR